MDEYDVARARQQNAIRNRAFELERNVIVTAFAQERECRLYQERREAEQAADVLMRFCCTSCRPCDFTGSVAAV